MSTSGHDKLDDLQVKEFKCMMSLEKAEIFQQHPKLIINTIENIIERGNAISVHEISFSRTDHNLKMNTTIFTVKYTLA